MAHSPNATWMGLIPLTVSVSAGTLKQILATACYLTLVWNQYGISLKCCQQHNYYLSDHQYNTISIYLGYKNEVIYKLQESLPKQWAPDLPVWDTRQKRGKQEEKQRASKCEQREDREENKEGEKQMRNSRSIMDHTCVPHSLRSKTVSSAASYLRVWKVYAARGAAACRDRLMLHTHKTHTHFHTQTQTRTCTNTLTMFFFPDNSI